MYIQGKWVWFYQLIQLVHIHAQQGVLRYCNCFLFRATHVQSEDGSLILLNSRNFTQRLGLARRLLAPDKLESSKGSTKKVGKVSVYIKIILVVRFSGT